MRHAITLPVLAIIGFSVLQPSMITSQPQPDRTPSDEKKREGDLTGWKKYAPAEAEFRVYFPREPMVAPPSEANGNLYVASVRQQNKDDLGFVVQWRIEDKARENRAAEKINLFSQQVGALSAVKGRLVEGKEITRSDYLGRDFTISIEGGDVCRMCTYIAGKRTIILQVWGKNEEAMRSEKATRFLNSLSIDN